MQYQYTPSDVTRFWAKVDCSGGLDACWLWLGKRTPRGYGRCTRHSREYYAHRLAWLYTYGAWPTAQACHNCPGGDNTSCVNPRHLFNGTPAEHGRDRAAKGQVLSGDQHPMHRHPERRARGARHGSQTRPERVARGERARAARLTVAQVQAVRAAVRDGARVTVVARQYGVSHSAIHNIVQRKTWRHVP
jgi:hypothetical protein